MQSVVVLVTWVAVLGSLQGIDIPVFIRSDAHSGLFPLEIPNNITASELYTKIPGIGIGDVLSVGDTEIEKTDSRHIADLSICPQTVINIICRRPTDAESLYYFAMDLKNKELIPWWKQALHCHHYPAVELCQQDIVCNWPGIYCKQMNLTWSVSLDAPFSHPFPAGKRILSGTLVLNRLPLSVHFFEATNAQFDDIDFRGLSDHQLQSVDVESNSIKSIEFGDLKNTKIEHLDVAFNQIQSANLLALEDSVLEVLFLNGNKISEIDFGGMNKCALTHLDLDQNNLTEISLEGIEGSSLNELVLVGNPLERIDFKGIKSSSLSFILLPFPLPDEGSKIVARNVEELIVSELRRGNKEAILSMIVELKI